MKYLINTVATVLLFIAMVAVVLGFLGLILNGAMFIFWVSCFVVAVICAALFCPLIKYME